MKNDLKRPFWGTFERQVFIKSTFTKKDIVKFSKKGRGVRQSVSNPKKNKKIIRIIHNYLQSLNFIRYEVFSNACMNKIQKNISNLKIGGIKNDKNFI